MGDNRLVSKDSRDSDVGVVNKNEIVGEVSMRLFPI
ncbi:S26 family signal peptidase [Paraclostridium bifermentans]|nr:S26 family signal peptidase [Paraclostridium bifermentans]